MSTRIPRWTERCTWPSEAGRIQHYPYSESTMISKTSVLAVASVALGAMLGYVAASCTGVATASPLTTQQRSREAEFRQSRMASRLTEDAGLLAQLPPQVAAAAIAQAEKKAGTSGKKPNIVIIWGDDVGQSDISAYSMGLMGFRSPNIARLAKEGGIFTDYYAQQSCTAGRSSFITGQSGPRTGNTKVGMPGAAQGLQARDVTIAQLLKAQGYATAQFGKNHLGDRNEHLPTVHGFD